MAGPGARDPGRAPPLTVAPAGGLESPGPTSVMECPTHGPADPSPVDSEQFQEPRWARFLFASQAAAWLWLVIRLYLAYIFIPAGWHKITEGGWVFGDGAPIQGMVSGAVAAEGTPGWYVWFLENIVQPNASLFATLVASAELAVGLGLARRAADRDRRVLRRVHERQLRACGVAGLEPDDHHPRPVPRHGLAERGLDRPRSLVHPVHAQPVLGGHRGEPRTRVPDDTTDLTGRGPGTQTPATARGGGRRRVRRLVQRVAVARAEDPDRAMRHEVERVGDERVHPVLGRRELDDGALGRREVDRREPQPPAFPRRSWTPSL